MMKRCALIVALALVTCCSVAAASGLKVVTENLPPFNIAAQVEGAAPSGIATDTLVAIFDKIGRQFDPAAIEVMPWARAYQTAKNEPSTLLYSAVRTEERESMFQWIGPIEHLTIGLIVLKDRKLVINNVKELEQYTIGTVRNGAPEQLLKKAGVSDAKFDVISDQQAAGMMLQGMTVQYLLRSTFRVQAGDTILFHAAAGGVGLIACQWAKHLGATVIGTVGSEEKAKLAQAHGCDHTILYREENIVERVKEITDGVGVPVVYDSIGKDTFEASLDCLRPLGLMVSFGNASGPVQPFETGILAQKGSLFFTRPTLMTYTAERDNLVESAEELIDVVSSGVVKIEVNQTYPLAEAAQAHRDLEARKTTGSTVLFV